MIVGRPTSTAPMHTVLVILEGFVLFALCLVVARLATQRGTARRTQAMQTAARLFIGLWLVCAFFNLWKGVSEAGYSIVEELPIFLLVFAIPAGVAAWYAYRSTLRATDRTVES